jgi:hypothetical protein
MTTAIAIGRAHALMGATLRDQLAATRADRHWLDFLLVSDKQFDNDGTRLIEFESRLLPEGYCGMQDVIIEGDKVRFAKDVDV